MYIAVFIGTCLLAVPASAQSLKWRVTDDKGEAIYGAVVSVPDLRIGTVTDSFGYYRMENLARGRYLVEVRLLGYGTATAYVSVNEEAEHHFKLSTSLIEKNEIIVTGTSAATEERRSVSPVQSIRVKELRENASTNIVDALAKQPGINQLSTGPAISKPIIRGLGYNRIITMNDGIRQEGQQWGDEHGIEIDDYHVSRVEILKGPASLSYGSDALAGVINIISDDVPPLGSVTGNVTANYQTNNGLAALHAQTAGNVKGFNWSAFGTGKYAHDYKNAYDGYVHNSRFSNRNFGAAAGVAKKWGYSRLSFTSFNQTLGIVEGDRDSATGRFLKLIDDNGEEGEGIATDEDGRSYDMQTPSQLISHNKLVWTNNLFMNNGGRIGLTLGYQQNTRKELEDVLDPEIPGLHFLLRSSTYDVRYYLPLINGWQMTTGINGMKQQNRNEGVEFLVPDYELFDAGVFGIAKKDWKAWSVSGGLRFNYRNISSENLFLDSTDARVNELEAGGHQQFTAFDRSFSNLVGSIGASYSVNRQMTLKLNVASGFRAPNIAELSANGVHEGTIRYEYGNASLAPESSIQADLGMIWNSDHVLVNAAVFYNYIRNFIYIRKLLSTGGTDSIPIEPNEEGYPAFVFDQANAALYGGELYVDVHPHPFDWLHLDNTLSFVRGINFSGSDSTRNLPAIPAPRWIVELRAQKQSLGKWARNAYAKVGLDVNLTQDNVFSAYSTETRTGGYTLLNAGLGLDITNRRQATICSVTLSGQNLADIAYQSHLSRLKYAPGNNLTGRNGVFGAGRNLSLLLSFPFIFK